ncbi:hypothetical protein C8R44DRAFT_883534 [Mycena epipterygia]|nr:hypothetical protein C8R44DRAFT_883534 [Mycena epipterygia]
MANWTSVSFPSTPTISTPSDLTPSPETPPSLLPAFFTPKHPQRKTAPSRPPTPKAYTSDDDMAPLKTTELFRGTGTAEKAHTWLRTLEQTWKYDADEKEKLYRFEKGLHPGGQAEEWWTSLPATDTKSWTLLMVAFEKKWPRPKPTRRAQDVVIRDLMTNVLDRSALGKYVDDEDGVSVLSHVAWAEVTRKLIGELVGGDAGMMLKSAVHGTLPVEFRHLLNDTNLNTWEQYLKAVEDVGVDRINDAVEERTARYGNNQEIAQRNTQNEALAAQLFASLGLASPARGSRAVASPRGTYVPPAARQSQPAAATPYSFTPPPGPRPYQTPSTATDPRTPWASRASPDVFGGSTVRPPPNTFTKSLLATPLSPSSGRGRPTTLSGDPAADVDLARHITAHPCTYPSDAAGTQRYTTDMAAWMSQYGNSTSPDYTTFPLTPGTSAPGTRECFRCGILTNPPHFGERACLAQNGREVPVRERNVRSIVGGIIYPPGQRTNSRISQIQEVPYDLFGGFDPD